MALVAEENKNQQNIICPPLSVIEEVQTIFFNDARLLMGGNMI